MFAYSCLFSKSKKYMCRKFTNHFKEITKIVCDYTGIGENDAQEFLKKYELENRQPDFMIDSFETYKKFGFKTKDIIENGKLFNYYPREHEQHHWVMEEGGFSNFTPKIFTRARALIKQKISHLKEEGFIPKHINVAESFLSYIENPEFVKGVEIMYSDNLKWSAVHFIIARQFLAWRLQVTDTEIKDLYVTQTGIPHKSFRVMEENISIAEYLGFSLQKILKCGYLIRNYPENPKQTLKEFPTLAGCDMRNVMRSNPTLVVTPTRKIRKTYEVLKEFKIPDESIKKVMGILQLSPETVRSRLNEIKNSPDTEPLLKIPRLLKLLIHHSKAKSRMPFLKHLNLQCTNFRILCAQNDEPLKQFIREGKDINSKQDVCAYLKNTLQLGDKKDLLEKISKHSYYLNVPLKDIGETFNYLRKCGFQLPNIYQVIWILLYPMEKIRTTLHALKNDENLQFYSLNQVQKLNLILYSIERDHHFTGHGIFKGEVGDFQEQLKII